jgi:hypothetical protein
VILGILKKMVRGPLSDQGVFSKSPPAAVELLADGGVCPVDFGCEVIGSGTFGGMFMTLAKPNRRVVPADDHPGKVESAIGPLLLIDPGELFSRTENPPYEGTEIEEQNTSRELIVKTSSSSDMPGCLLAPEQQ